MQVTGGEVAFVPRVSLWPWDNAEDDGYLLLFTHNDETGTSDFRSVCYSRGLTCVSPYLMLHMCP